MKPRGKAKSKLAQGGRTRLRVIVSYTPDGGDKNTKTKRVKLVKRS